MLCCAVLTTIVMGLTAIAMLILHVFAVSVVSVNHEQRRDPVSVVSVTEERPCVSGVSKP